MPLPPASNWRGRGSAWRAVIILSLGAALLASAQMLDFKKTDGKKSETEEGMATWYQVPAQSLTKQRAGKDELTAAHARLPFGTRVRVTHLKNGKSVVVRIIDRIA